MHRACLIAELMLLILLVACGSNSKPAHHEPIEGNGGAVHERNEGYGLLYDLMMDESKVDGLLVIKHADEPLGRLIKQISATCRDAKAKLDAFKTEQSRIVFDEPDLPKLEQEARDLESSRDAKNLLLSSGKDFELNLIFTQAQAMGYATNLCQAIAKHDDDSVRREFLTKLGQQFAGFRDQLMGMLVVKG
jgi:hypothetical protein